MSIVFIYHTFKLYTAHFLQSPYFRYIFVTVNYEMLLIIVCGSLIGRSFKIKAGKSFNLLLFPLAAHRS